MTLDLFQLDRAGGTMEEVRARVGADRQCATQRSQAKLWPACPIFDRLMPGEGTLPLFALLNAALATSPDAAVDVEVFNTELKRFAGRLSQAILSSSGAFLDELKYYQDTNMTNIKTLCFI